MNKREITYAVRLEMGWKCGYDFARVCDVEGNAPIEKMMAFIDLV